MQGWIMMWNSFYYGPDGTARMTCEYVAQEKPVANMYSPRPGVLDRVWAEREFAQEHRNAERKAVWENRRSFMVRTDA